MFVGIVGNINIFIRLSAYVRFFIRFGRLFYVRRVQLAVSRAHFATILNIGSSVPSTKPYWDINCRLVSVGRPLNQKGRRTVSERLPCLLGDNNTQNCHARCTLLPKIDAVHALYRLKTSNYTAVHTAAKACLCLRFFKCKLCLCVCVSKRVRLRPRMKYNPYSVRNRQDLARSAPGSAWHTASPFTHRFCGRPQTLLSDACCTGDDTVTNYVASVSSTDERWSSSHYYEKLPLHHSSSRALLSLSISISCVVRDLDRACILFEQK